VQPKSVYLWPDFLTKRSVETVHPGDFWNHLFGSRKIPPPSGGLSFAEIGLQSRGGGSACVEKAAQIRRDLTLLLFAGLLAEQITVLKR
jgi:hypothetical protein